MAESADQASVEVPGGDHDPNVLRNQIVADIARVAEQGSVSPEGPLGKVAQSVFNQLLPLFRQSEDFKNVNLSDLVVPSSADKSDVYVIHFELNDSQFDSSGEFTSSRILRPNTEKGKALRQLFQDAGYTLIPGRLETQFALVISTAEATKLLNSGEAQTGGDSYRRHLHQKFTMQDTNLQ